MQVDLESRGLVQQAFRGFGERPNYDNRVFDLRDLLTPRARRWLEAQVADVQQHFLVECTSNQRHFRSLSYVERSTQYEWIRTRDMDDEAYEKDARYHRDLVNHMGRIMADSLIETASRPGFIRRFFAPPQHTVPEATDTQLRLARRIQSRLKPIRPIRTIIQQLHSHSK